MRPIVLGLVLAAFSLPAFAAEPDGPGALITKTEAVRIAVQNKLSPKSPTARKNEQAALVEYYSVPDQPLIWVDDKGLNERAKLAMAEIANADDYGLKASNFALPKADGFDPNDPKATDWLADAEVKLSYAVLDYANDARGGRIDPQRLSENLDPTLALPDPSEVIASIAFRSDPAAYLRSFQPDQPQFEALRQKLLELRGGKPVETAKPDVVTIPDGPVLKFGMEDEQVALLRKRLNVQSEPGTNEKLFDKAVLDAVRSFQYAHGTIPDGLVGAGTRRMLNGQQQQPQRQLGGQGRIDAILVNMERWRWLPHELGPFYVTVNIPEFMLRVVEDGKTIHSSRVVTGKPDKQTPVLSDDMEEIVFNPYWNVPNSIKMEEIAPYFGQGGGFFGGWDTSILQRHGLLIRYGGRDIDPNSIDWSRNDIRNFDLVQPPGPSNVLGRVKFVFPNKHDVYMHDTTQKNLFAQTVRAESHGCMRVQYPEKLAEIILNHDKGWSPARVESTFDAGGDNHVALDHKIPVYITYFTVKVNDDGSLSTFNDIYGHDSRMIAALNGKYVPYQPASDDEVVAGQYRPWNKRTRRETIDNDFTRALFGF
ncbi:MAG TPA: L,D-transpeptidase family protein [Methyloceanibacter sp.]|jgi:L,D-transpeptidase YcbB|nr:L,D-transpeptidase family protein [Methyloceanibacter sp.]